MSGHSKWHSIKHKKAATDAKKGAAFTKLAKNITIAAREGGGDPEMNFSLRLAIEKATGGNMPNENIERAINKGTGEGDAVAIEEAVYEAMGPGGAAILITVLTDNKNRSVTSVKTILTKNGATFGASVLWQFEKRAVIRIATENMGSNDMDEFELEAIDAGVDDIQKEEEGITLLGDMGSFQKMNEFVESKGIKADSAEIEYVAKDVMELSDEDNEKLENIIELLEEDDDVDNVYTNVA